MKQSQSKQELGPFWLEIQKQERESLLEAFDRGWLKQYDAPICDQLKEELSNFFGKQLVRLCGSGTVAVELALRGCGVSSGDRVLLSTYDFPGNFRCIEAIGARPVLVDVRDSSWTPDLDRVTDAVETRKVDAVLLSFLHGSLFDTKNLHALCQEKGIPLILDGCQVPGATLNSLPIGQDCNAFCLSFGGSKLLSAGRGGAVLTNDASISQRMEIFSFRGNESFPLSVAQAAVLMPQVRSLCDATLVRWQTAKSLWQISEKFPWLSVPVEVHSKTNGEECRPAFYKFGWILDTSVPREVFLKLAKEFEIPFGEGFRGFGRRSKKRCDFIGSLDNASDVVERTVLLAHSFLPGIPKVDKELLGRFERFLANFGESLKSEH